MTNILSYFTKKYSVIILSLTQTQMNLPRKKSTSSFLSLTASTGLKHTSRRIVKTDTQQSGTTNKVFTTLNSRHLLCRPWTKWSQKGEEFARYWRKRRLRAVFFLRDNSRIVVANMSWARNDVQRTVFVNSTNCSQSEHLMHTQMYLKHVIWMYLFVYTQNRARSMVYCSY